MEEFLQWCSQVSLTRPIKDPGDDFSDGVLVAEVIKHHIPTLVDLDTYQTTRQYDMKLINWKSLNRMVFKKIGFEANIYDLECVCMGQPSAVGDILVTIRKSVENYLHEEQRRKLFPAAKVKRDHLNQKLESIRSTLLRQRTSHSPEKTPLKKTRGNVLVLTSQNNTTGERQFKIPPMTAPELNAKSLGEMKTKEPTNVKFNTDLTLPLQGEGDRTQIQSLEQKIQEANNQIRTLKETLDKTGQENTELKALMQTYERNMEKILADYESLQQETQRKDAKIEELQIEMEKLMSQMK